MLTQKGILDNMTAKQAFLKSQELKFEGIIPAYWKFARSRKKLKVGQLKHAIKFESGSASTKETLELMIQSSTQMDCPWKLPLRIFLYTGKQPHL